jgi:hypothetical protein
MAAVAFLALALAVMVQTIRLNQALAREQKLAAKLKPRLLLDPEFQVVHYLDADLVEQTISGSAAELAPVLEQAGYVVKSRGLPTFVVPARRSKSKASP